MGSDLQPAHWQHPSYSDLCSGIASLASLIKIYFSIVWRANVRQTGIWMGQQFARLSGLGHWDSVSSPHIPCKFYYVLQLTRVVWCKIATKRIWRRERKIDMVNVDIL